MGHWHLQVHRRPRHWQDHLCSGCRLRLQLLLGHHQPADRFHPRQRVVHLRDQPLGGRRRAASNHGVPVPAAARPTPAPATSTPIPITPAFCTPAPGCTGHLDQPAGHQLAAVHQRAHHGAMAAARAGGRVGRCQLPTVKCCTLLTRRAGVVWHVSASGMRRREHGCLAQWCQRLQVRWCLLGEGGSGLAWPRLISSFAACFPSAPIQLLCHRGNGGRAPQRQWLQLHLWRLGGRNLQRCRPRRPLCLRCKR